MCGIGLVIGCSSEADASIQHKVEEGIKKDIYSRGPDAQGTASIPVSCSASINVSLLAAVLALRGESITSQPCQDEDGNILCWNGEIFGGLEVGPQSSDTQLLFHSLRVASSSASSSELSIPLLMARIEGPYAFFFYESRTNKLWLGRDPLGRRSLVLSRGRIHSSSSSSASASASAASFALTICSTPLDLPSLDLFVEPPPAPADSIGSSAVVDAEEDSSQLSSGSANRGMWTEFPVNGVYCIDMNSMSRLSTIGDDWFSSMSKCYRWKDLYSALGQTTCPLYRPRVALDYECPFSRSEVASQFLDVMDNAVKLRVSNVFDPSSSPSRSSSPIPHSRVGVLFSGGIDCIVVAALASRHIPIEEPIDLMNVSFGDKPNDAPDRKTAIAGVQELQTACPGRIWRLILVDVSSAELQSCSDNVARLITPCNTVLDLHIAEALWFAARGRGRIWSSDPSAEIVMYESKARVLLSGLGSDEQLGGYRRHLGKFHLGGWQGLEQELEMDTARMWIRNLGRDDRVLTEHARETRFPFLDEGVMSYIRSIPLSLIIDPATAVTAGGDKRILRDAARLLHLHNAATLAKRAIQFGSRIAKVSTIRGKGQTTF